MDTTAASLAAACAPIHEDANRAVRFFLRGLRALPLTREQLTTLPYAAIRATIRKAAAGPPSRAAAPPPPTTAGEPP